MPPQKLQSNSSRRAESSCLHKQHLPNSTCSMNLTCRPLPPLPSIHSLITVAKHPSTRCVLVVLHVAVTFTLEASPFRLHLLAPPRTLPASRPPSLPVFYHPPFIADLRQRPNGTNTPAPAYDHQPRDRVPRLYLGQTAVMTSLRRRHQKKHVVSNDMVLFCSI